MLECGLNSSLIQGYYKPWLGSPCYGKCFSQIHYATRSSPSLFLLIIYETAVRLVHNLECLCYAAFMTKPDGCMTDHKTLGELRVCAVNRL